MGTRTQFCSFSHSHGIPFQRSLSLTQAGNGHHASPPCREWSVWVCMPMHMGRQQRGLAGDLAAEGTQCVKQKSYHNCLTPGFTVEAQRGLWYPQPYPGMSACRVGFQEVLSSEAQSGCRILESRVSDSASSSLGVTTVRKSN